jgi:hypothetical protein
LLGAVVFQKYPGGDNPYRQIGQLVEGLSDKIVLTEDVPVARNRSVGHGTFSRDPQTVHLPDVNLPAVVAPENVAALAVIVIVADVLDVPIGADRSVRDGAFHLDVQAVHLPDVDLASILAPENVAVAVTVEVAEALDVPIVGDESVRHTAFGFDPQAIHLPEIDLPAVVAPENVALTITIEVAETLDVPVVGDRSATPPSALIARPSISQK